MIPLIRSLLCATLFVLLSACAAQPSHNTPFIADGIEAGATVPAGAVLQRRILLLGDAGASTLEPWQASLARSAERAALAPDKTTVLLLGDNIYYRGFPRKDDDQAEYTEKQRALIQRLDAQLRIAEASGAELYVLPGNHDWYAEQVDDQANYVEDYGRQRELNVHFEPYEAGQPPLPEVIHRDGISIVFLDSMWMIQGEDSDVELAAQRLRELLRETRQQHPDNLVLLSAHHPLETMGPHGKYFSSSGYRFTVWLIGLFTDIDAQDLPHPRYTRMTDAIREVLADCGCRSVFAAGHDHSLQLFGNRQQSAPQYRIVSGAANTSKLTGVGNNANSLFALSQEGFVELDVYDRGVLLRSYSIAQPEPVFSYWLWE